MKFISDLQSSNSKVLAKSYNSAYPYPHAVCDDFLTPEAFDFVKHHFPKPESEVWKTPSNEFTINKSVTKRGDNDLKTDLFDIDQMKVINFLNSVPFIRFLENLTGISGLISDPYLAEAGFNVSRSGGILDHHADFSHHDHTGLERRINVIVYVSDYYEPSFGGALELLSPDGEMIKKIEPLPNRAIIFSTGEETYHGWDKPIEAPEEYERRSLNMYYYTVPRKERTKRKVKFVKNPGFKHEVTSE
jgi:Rps23 Pro-64 3,4-dihydroxylase Tpa1-like proline 4-hydroxylase